MTRGEAVNGWDLFRYENAVKKLLAEQTVALWHTWLTLDGDDKRKEFRGRVATASDAMADRFFGAQRRVVDMRQRRNVCLTAAAASNLQHLYES